MYIARLKDNINEWVSFACDGTGPDDESIWMKRVQKWSRQNWLVVYSWLFPCIFGLDKLLIPFFARMQRYQLGARLYNFPPLPMIFTFDN